MGSIEGFILAGGQSRRMGTDKSRLIIEGETFVERITNELSQVADGVRVVGTGDTLIDHVPRIPDVYPNWGALGGVHAALSTSSADWALVVACDFPFVTAPLFRRLAAERADFEAVAPLQKDLIPQPLCTLYRVTPCLARADQLIKSGERKPIALLQSVRTRWISFSEIADLEGANNFFDNINSPEDYSRIIKERR
jgi:molybdopterin-guanine dinucleotide biosynthesis protein A